MFKTVSEQVKLQRLEICVGCELYVKSMSACKSCGCYMPAKAMFASTECPEGKWSTSAPGESLINKIEEMILQHWDKN